MTIHESKGSKKDTQHDLLRIDSHGSHVPVWREGRTGKPDAIRLPGLPNVWQGNLWGMVLLIKTFHPSDHPTFRLSSFIQLISSHVTTS